MLFKSYGVRDLYTHFLLSNKISNQLKEDIQIVSSIYPFRTNNYIVDNLVSWDNIPDDPIFRLNFPHKNMLSVKHYELLRSSIASKNKDEISKSICEIRGTLNPHPAGQLDRNIPYDENGHRADGIQHKYKTTVLLFPSHSQTCHAYCTFCFRWPQFTDDIALKIQMKEVDSFLRYLNEHKEVDDVLITGGDPFIMKSHILESYIKPLLKIDHIRFIRIGTKSLSYWPYKFVTDEDHQHTLDLMEQITRSGKHLAFMAHFNHPSELHTDIVEDAIRNVRQTGAEIRCQSPLLKNINNSPAVWAEMWKRQIELGCIPYFMFLPRDTGAQHYFAETLPDALNIFRNAINMTSGLCKTVRGPVMSVENGKVEIIDFDGDRFYLRYVQHRDPSLCYQLFSARSKSHSPIWFDDLCSADEQSDKFF